MRISDWSSDVCSSDLSQSFVDATRHPNELRIAFDGDAVLFSDEAEQVFQSSGLDAFQSHETTHAARPLPAGPFKPLLEALQRLQRAAGAKVDIKLRTALVTARSAPAHERAIRTLMDWGIEVDEAMFLGGLQKGPFLQQFEPDRSEEHTSELQSLMRISYAVFCLKKKNEPRGMET